MKEIWKDIPEFMFKYQASNLGRIKSLPRKFVKQEKILSPYSDRQNYQIVILGKKTLRAVHRLVAQAFIENPDNLPFVCHKDDNPLNNTPDNLFWGTHLDNEKDKRKKERHFFGRMYTCEICNKTTNVGNWHKHHKTKCNSTNPKILYNGKNPEL